MIIEIDNELLKIQVKTAEKIDADGSIHFSIKYTANNRKNIVKKYTKEDIDYFLLYSLELDEFYMVSVEEATGRGFYIRLNKTKNSQSKNVHYREDYLLENVLCVETLYNDSK